jgi:thiol-disulfide isomerase/thioredoxin
MLSIKKNICKKAKGIMLFAFILFQQISLSQSLTEIQELVSKFYNQKTLSYSFEKKWYLNDGAILWHFNNNFYAYREKGNAFYLHENYITKNNFRYENIKNRSYYGTNVMRQQDYYKDYKTEDRDFMDGYDPHHIFSQDGFFREMLNDKKYKTKITDLKKLYLLELHDTTEVESNLPGVIMTDKISRYYISKQDGSIIKSYRQSTGLGRTDSAIYTYVYTKRPEKEVLSKINNFRPLKLSDELERKKEWRDSGEAMFRAVTQCPQFILPDTSGNLYASSEISARYVMLEFWYKNCGPCLINMKNVELVRNRFSPEDLSVIAINIQDSLDASLKKKVRNFNTSFTWLFNGQDLNAHLKIYAYPTTLIYDRQTGEIILREVGAGEEYAPTIIRFLENRLSR